MSKQARERRLKDNEAQAVLRTIRTSRNRPNNEYSAPPGQMYRHHHRLLTNSSITQMASST